MDFTIITNFINGIKEYTATIWFKIFTPTYLWIHNLPTWIHITTLIILYTLAAITIYKIYANKEELSYY